MTIFERNKDLHCENIKAIYHDGSIIEGFWSDWIDAEDNDWREDEGLEPCESIIIITKDGRFVDASEDELADIQEA